MSSATVACCRWWRPAGSREQACEEPTNHRARVMRNQTTLVTTESTLGLAGGPRGERWSTGRARISSSGSGVGIPILRRCLVGAFERAERDELFAHKATQNHTHTHTHTLTALAAASPSFLPSHTPTATTTLLLLRGCLLSAVAFAFRLRRTKRKKQVVRAR